ncbi:sulfatase-like hydrolase/transferase [Aromatoleum sp.]|uniref:sulfatase-like hydrolase/transferase n=1 Tax=Aromatoleum sp. TaxID=2307007 RepID=UPI002FCCA684
MSSLPSPTQLDRFFLLSWLLACAQLASSQTSAQYAGFAVAAWSLATTLTYAFLYLLPAVTAGHVLRRLLGRAAPTRGRGAVLAVATVGLAALTHVLLFSDRVIFRMYGFHINGFVVDLVSTPGGIESLGASTGTVLTAALIVLGLIATHAFAYAWTTRARRLASGSSRRQWSAALALFVVLTLGERIAYGYSAMTNFQPILFASERYPLYQPLTFGRLAKRLGVAADEVPAARLHVGGGALTYPLAALTVEAPSRPLNIVWLVAESLRFDMLDPEIMPNLRALSNDALRLENHYSGANMTQMGVFSMFYGLYGNYWFTMLAARRQPVLMDVLQQQDYQFSLHTSQRFTYPAFDKTVFAGMRPGDLHPLDTGGSAWQRDAINIDHMTRFIDGRDRARPFMTYMFFEGTHANYDFPEAGAIARPYLEDFNYLTTDFATQMPLIKNRYVNAAHQVDKQIGRVVEHLRASGLLDDTIVIVLGDHGEEFMERSRWGHGAQFNRFQTGTPAVIRVPGRKPAVITGITSHLDLPATLMPLLGVRNPASDYSLGQDLFAPGFHRRYAVVADWNRVAYIGDDFKVTFPINALGAGRNEATDGEDHPLDDPAAAIITIRSSMVEIMGNLARFSGRG